MSLKELENIRTIVSLMAKAEEDRETISALHSRIIELEIANDSQKFDIRLLTRRLERRDASNEELEKLIESLESKIRSMVFGKQ